MQVAGACDIYIMKEVERLDGGDMDDGERRGIMYNGEGTREGKLLAHRGRSGGGRVGRQGKAAAQVRSRLVGSREQTRGRQESGGEKTITAGAAYWLVKRRAPSEKRDEAWVERVVYVMVCGEQQEKERSGAGPSRTSPRSPRSPVSGSRNGLRAGGRRRTSQQKHGPPS